ncbi:serine hydrolase [Pusillimonas caeni]|uniref:serine hydrolase n=1 Tax=Pusillimonas caeni TaxID=1348472 RepID=UPI000E59B742|nr:serine hydrolase [Pusillimonas caeni]TFL11452.1 serine hydrolase [Pusillimonas caeni]
MHSSRLYRVLLASAAAVALASCGGGGSSSQAQIPPARVTAAVAQLDDLAAEILERSVIPGLAVAVVHQGKTVYAKGFGVRKLGDPAPVDPETVFQLASVSKSVGATVVAAQVGAGVVTWDTLVARDLPWFALNDPEATARLTVGDLYSHQSGLPDHAGDDLEELGYTRLETMERLRFLASAPLRSRYAYTNFGITTAAQAVATAAGVAWEDLSQETIYGPLGMASTSSRYADFMARANRAHPHIRDGDGFQPGPIRQPDAQTPAGGVSSNVLDMAQWMSMVLREGKHEGRQLIPENALTPALSPQVMTSPPSGEQSAGYYGYGFNVSTSRAGFTQLGHSGAFLMGAGTSFNLLPAADTGIVVLTNALPVGAAEALCLSYLDLVQFGHITRDWLDVVGPYFADMAKPFGELAGAPFPTDPAPALPAHAYTGVYGNDYYGDARVEQRGGELVLALGPVPKMYALQHWSGNVFVFEPDGEMAPADSRSAVTFAVGPGGVAQSLAIELYQESGVGTLERH